MGPVSIDGRRRPPLREGAFGFSGCELYAQPIVSTSFDSKVNWVEILIRRKGARRESDSGLSCLRLARQAGLSGSIDQFVVTSVFDHLEDLDSSTPKVAYGINLMGSSLCDPKFKRFLFAQLGRLKRPEQICFEITETEVIENLHDAAEFMSEVKKFGCSFALDDFGSGFCSFTYIKNLPIDIIKIDGQFVRECRKGGVDYELVSSIHTLCLKLGLSTVAECIESAKIYETMRDIGVDFGQGNFLGYPRPLVSLNKSLPWDLTC